MTLSGISTASPITPTATVTPTASTAVSGSGMAYTNAAVPGAAMAQPSTAKTVLKDGAVGGVLGAAIGGGAMLLAGMVPFLAPIAIVGAPMGALIGAGVGAALGMVKGFITSRKQKQEIEAVEMAQGSGSSGQVVSNAATAPVDTSTIAAAPSGPTYGHGATGSGVSQTQRLLKQLGLYSGPITGKMDMATSNAVKHYETLKGASSDGLSTPALRAALANDAQVSGQYAAS